MTNTHHTTTDTKHIADCPRREIYTDRSGVHIICKPLPITESFCFEQLIEHPEFFIRREVTCEDCEKCKKKKLPSLHKRLQNYKKALVEWGKAKLPERTPEEVAKLYEICKECDALENGICLDCGCHISLEGVPIMNKLKMATTHCVRGLW